MNRFTDDVPFSFELPEEKPNKEWAEEPWLQTSPVLPKCITQNAENDPTAQYGLSLLKRASQISGNMAQLSIEGGFSEATFSHNETLKLVRQAREFQECRILSPQKAKQADQEVRSPLRLKIIRKRSRKQSKTSKTDSTSEGRNDIESDNIDNLVEPTTHLHLSDTRETPELEGRLIVQRQPLKTQEYEFWQESVADYLGIQRLIF